jgi:phage terminase large subunit-like protein
VTWLLMGGRGVGKTRAGAEWVRALAADGLGPIALVGESITEAIAVMVDGVSGLMAVSPPWERPKLSGATLQWPNAEAAWDMLQFGLRLGDRPRQLVTTTPRPTRLIKRLLADPSTVVTRMTTAENKRHLAGSFLSAVVARYRGTVLGRQELEGELIEDLPGALWTREMFRRDDGATRHRVVVLEDLTLKPASPVAWATRAVRAFRDYRADCIVAEVNQGGEMVRAVIAQVGTDAPVRTVHATRGKWVRAEPVAALYAQGRVTHAPGLTALEDEMCAFGVDGMSEGHSPDRLDAAVWAITELMLRDEPRVRGM